MSPWELIAIYLVLPVLVIGGWLHHRYETDGPSVPAFEAWCEAERPVVFALRGSVATCWEVARSLRDAVGERMEVEHHGGRFPWTSYVLRIRIEVDERGADSVVRVRAERGKVRRKVENRPDLVALLEQVVRSARAPESVWLHTEARDGDETRGDARRGRGWLAQSSSRRGRAGLGEFALTPRSPEWVRRSIAASTPPSLLTPGRVDLSKAERRGARSSRGPIARGPLLAASPAG